MDQSLENQNTAKVETATPAEGATSPRTQEPPKAPTPDPRDHAHRILLDVPLDDGKKADLWDSFYQAQNADALARSLEGFDIPAHITAALVTAKKLADSEKPVPSRADKLKVAVNQLSQMDPKTLAVAESHPNILKFLLGAPKE